MKRFLKMKLFVLIILLISACSDVEEVQHIEVFAVETLELNDQGFSERTGYKQVNAVTTTEASENHIKTDYKAIEDFYDSKGNYIRTEVIHSTFNKSLVTQAEEGEERKEEIHEPSTILIPDDLDNFTLDNPSQEEKKKIKEHVLLFMDHL